MKNKVRFLFMFLAVLFVFPVNVYASDDMGGCLDIIDISDFSDSDFPESNGSDEVVSFFYATYIQGVRNEHYITLESSDEICAAIYNDQVWWIVKDGQYLKVTDCIKVPGYADQVLDYSYTGSLTARFFPSRISQLDFFQIGSNMKVFDDYFKAVQYLDDGTLDGIIINPDSFKYKSEICFDDYDVEVHRSNYYKNYYIRFYIDPSDYLSSVDYDLYLSFRHDFELEMVSLLDDDCSCDDYFEIEKYNIKQSNGRFYYDFYPFEHITSKTSFGCDVKYIFHGKEFVGFDLDNISVDGLGLNLILGIKSSNIYFDLSPSVDGVFGAKYHADVDLLTGACESSFSEPKEDDSGHFKDDYEVVPDSVESKREHYYTKVDTDDNENPVYTYYYIDNHGIGTQINNDSGGSSSAPSSLTVNHKFGELNVNVNTSAGSSDVPELIIEDDDYKDDTLLKNIKNIYGYKDDLDTAQKNDGVLSYEQAIFKAMPDDIDGMLGYGIGTVVLCSIFSALFFRK